MYKKLTTFIMVLSIMLVGAVCVACSKDKTPSAHVHAFATLAGNEKIDFCEGCGGYLVKGGGSEYLEAGESSQTLDGVLFDESVQPIDGKMTFIISGAIDYDATVSGVSGGAADLAKGSATEVYIVGLGQNPELTLVTGDTEFADPAVFRTKHHNNQNATVATGKISVVGLKINDTRKTSSV